MSVYRLDVQTLKDPAKYSLRQIESAKRVAFQVNRGRFVYCLPPEGAS